jgi:hypothetical protein
LFSGAANSGQGPDVLRRENEKVCFCDDPIQVALALRRQPINHERWRLPGCGHRLGAPADTSGYGRGRPRLLRFAKRAAIEWQLRNASVL